MWHAFLGWMYHPIVKISQEESERLAPDLYRDPFYRALHVGHSQLDGPLCLLVNVLFRVGIFALWGPVVFAAELLAAICAFAAPLLVNLFCHLPSLGYAPYESHDQSRNNPVVAMLSFGEGWHNSHHAFPQSARFGLQPNEFDFSWEVIKIMKTLGLATEIRLGSADKSMQQAKAKSVVSSFKE
jgi:stearoyl-CoA desaturase (delta-9 desaturase)